MKLLDSFKAPDLCRAVLDEIRQEVSGEFRFMEVCGTHTVAMFQSGITSLLPPGVKHLSGPGCPVCVTHESEVAAFLDLAGKPGVIVVTFGDLMRVPGPGKKSLKQAQAEGARVNVVYSAADALKIAKDNPDHKVVFLGVGFETTAPTVAATIKTARDMGLGNFYVLPFHKLVPPALAALMADPEVKVQAFILPGHVSTVIGLEPYRFIAESGVPAAIAGFEPLDILQALLVLIRQINRGKPEAVNLYKRVAKDQGNPRAREIMYEVFMPGDALWRGIGTIPGSGLVFRDEYKAFDAMHALGLELPDVPSLPGCKCGDVLKGKMTPNQCPLFGKTCTPGSPVGPCMVSTEGSCAAYYKYQV